MEKAEKLKKDFKAGEARGLGQPREKGRLDWLSFIGFCVLTTARPRSGGGMAAWTDADLISFSYFCLSINFPFPSGNSSGKLCEQQKGQLRFNCDARFHVLLRGLHEDSSSQVCSASRVSEKYSKFTRAIFMR